MTMLDEQKRYRQNKWMRRITITVISLTFIVGVLFLFCNPIFEHIISPLISHHVNKEVSQISNDKIQDNNKKLDELLGNNKKNDKDKSYRNNFTNEPYIDNNNNGNNQYTAEQIKKALNDGSISLKDDPGIVYDYSNVRPIKASDMRKAHLNKNYLRGRIAIPKVGLNLPILEGVSDQNLWVGAGTMKPNQRMGEGNYALAGHYVEAPNLLFSPLHRVQIGYYIYTFDGNTIYQYKTTERKILSAHAGEAVENSQGNQIVTLITCQDLQAKQRLMIRGELVDKMKIGSAPQDIKENFE
ncbi:class A sortase [Staphylococcus sp. RIT622]|mgnify:FL=1|uniref:class A sortase n=1 Tax=Staphylococcus sp. RIT622 TaxID=2510795 RepID=UPI00101E31A6|nr:class A sortase [Staphylococcus sp. RIT622]MCG2544242.1 class A sortase [Staphylococcus epidermidis]RYL09514.1 class A sortase [Staphylococcus sp. RIT622]